MNLYQTIRSVLLLCRPTPRSNSGDKKVDELQKKLKDLGIKHDKEIENVDELQKKLKELSLKHELEMETALRKQQEEDAKKSSQKVGHLSFSLHAQDNYALDSLQRLQ